MANSGNTLAAEDASVAAQAAGGQFRVSLGRGLCRLTKDSGLHCVAVNRPVTVRWQLDGTRFASPYRCSRAEDARSGHDTQD